MHSLQVAVWAGLALWPQRASARGRFCTRIWGFGGGLSRVLTWSGVLSRGKGNGVRHLNIKFYLPWLDVCFGLRLLLTSCLSVIL